MGVFKLTPELVNGIQERTDDFREDSSVSTGSATLNDFKYSGYDRGHLCPAGSMTQNKTAMSETFFLSNMSPQTAGFNRGVWSRFETQVREWVNYYGDVWEVTGPVFKNNLDTIGASHVTVPGSYYKIIFRDNDKMIGFLLKHESSSKKLSEFAVKVDSIEALTGIDFFPGLENELEMKLERKVDTQEWKF
jgi:endonuclease G